MSLMLMSTSSTEEPAMISKDGNDRSRTSISTVRSSRRPSRSWSRIFSRVAFARSRAACGSSSGAGEDGGSSRSSSRSSALCSALCCTSSIFSSRTMSTADLDQVAHHRLDVAPDVAHLGELGCLHLEERRLREARQAPRDLRLADARRPDHQDVLRRHLLRHLRRQLLPAHAVAQGDRDRALRVVLADDVLVQLRDDLARRERFGGRGQRLRQVDGHAQSSSIVMFALV